MANAATPQGNDEGTLQWLPPPAAEAESPPFLPPAAAGPASPVSPKRTAKPDPPATPPRTEFDWLATPPGDQAAAAADSSAEDVSREDAEDIEETDRREAEDALSTDPTDTDPTDTDPPDTDPTDFGRAAAGTRKRMTSQRAPTTTATKPLHGAVRSRPHPARPPKRPRNESGHGGRSARNASHRSRRQTRLPSHDREGMSPTWLGLLLSQTRKCRLRRRRPPKKPLALPATRSRVRSHRFRCPSQHPTRARKKTKPAATRAASRAIRRAAMTRMTSISSSRDCARPLGSPGRRARLLSIPTTSPNVASL